MFKLCKLSLLLLAMVSISLVSCQKEPLDSPLSVEMLSEGGIDFKINQTPMEAITLNEEDKEDEIINQSLFSIAEKLTAFADNESFVQFVVEKAKSNEGLVLFEVVFSQFPEMKSILDNGQSLGTESCPFEHTGLFYKTALFVPNFDIASERAKPIVSPGIELYDDTETYNPDVIFAWHFDRNGQKTAINLGEVEAMKTSQPLFALTLELCDQQSEGLSRKDVTTRALPPIENELDFRMMSFSTNEYRINHRYDRSNNSEFYCQSARIDNNGVNYWINSSNGGRYKIDDVHKNDIGTQQSKWMHFAGNYTPYTQNVVYYNTYERDWYSSFKDLGQGNYQGTTLYFSGRRKYQDEWYSFDDDQTLNDHDPDFQDIVDTWTERIYFDNSKGYFNIWRVGS